MHHALQEAIALAVDRSCLSVKFKQQIKITITCREGGKGMNSERASVVPEVFFFCMAVGYTNFIMIYMIFIVIYHILWVLYYLEFATYHLHAYIIYK